MSMSFIVECMRCPTCEFNKPGRQQEMCGKRVCGPFQSREVRPKADSHAKRRRGHFFLAQRRRGVDLDLEPFLSPHGSRHLVRTAGTVLPALLFGERNRAFVRIEQAKSKGSAS